MHQGVFDAAEMQALRHPLAAFTVDAVDAALGADGRRALGTGDHDGVERALRAATMPTLRTLIRLFLLGRPVSAADAAAALHPLSLTTGCARGLLTCSAGQVRAQLEIRPYGEHDPTGAADSVRWWVVSDFGADVRPGPLGTDHVLGIGSASLTLAQLTPRATVRRALDVGTGCGVQALHLARHADHVVASDLSERALRFAATTAALSGQDWDLRAGSLLDPVPPGETFDLVVANPPFVVSDGTGGGDPYTYRDSGRPGDDACATLIRQLPRVLAPGGSAHLLANWLIAAPSAQSWAVRDWAERVDSWLADTGCDAWVWQREIVEPADYVRLWLRDAGLTPDRAEWAARYDAWLDWFAAQRVAAVGMGFVSMWRTGTSNPVRVLEDVPQAIDLPAGEQIADWILRARWLAAHDDDALLDSRLRARRGLTLERAQQLDEDGCWREVTNHLRQDDGLRWQVEIDDAVVGLFSACSGHRPLGVLVSLLAAAAACPVEEVTRAALPVVRDLVGRGFLLPPELMGATE